MNPKANIWDQKNIKPIYNQPSISEVAELMVGNVDKTEEIYIIMQTKIKATLMNIWVTC